MALQDVITTYEVAVTITRRSPDVAKVVIREDVVLFTPDEAAAFALVARLRQAAGV